MEELNSDSMKMTEATMDQYIIKNMFDIPNIKDGNTDPIFGNLEEDASTIENGSSKIEFVTCQLNPKHKDFNIYDIDNPYRDLVCPLESKFSNLIFKGINIISPYMIYQIYGYRLKRNVRGKTIFQCTNVTSTPIPQVTNQTLTDMFYTDFGMSDQNG